MQLQAMKYEHGHSGCVPWADWLPRIQCVSISLSNFYPTPLSSQIYKQGDNNQVSFKKATKQNGAEHAVLYGMWLSICFFFLWNACYFPPHCVCLNPHAHYVCFNPHAGTFPLSMAAVG